MKLYVVFYDNKSVQVFEDKMDAHEWALDTFGGEAPVDVRAFTDQYLGYQSNGDTDITPPPALQSTVD